MILTSDVIFLGSMTITDDGMDEERVIALLGTDSVCMLLHTSSNQMREVTVVVN